MCIIEKFNKDWLIWLEIAVILISCTLHIIFGFLRKVPDFNTYELFNLSPFFDFSLNNNCNNKVNNVFHTWGGWKREEKDVDKTYSWHYYDKTNITKFNENYYCYTFISYKDLLNNGQIIENGKVCPNEYNNNCGRIDTLNQELCIKKNEKCPLYDIGIGLPPDDTNYIYNNDSNIYYNNDNYNITNKTIIGRLILNDGQPCYQSNEKLWKQFSPSETDETHLNCTNIQIFGKSTEDRFVKRGEITYKKIYEDNLSERAKKIIFNSPIGNEFVSLYKREFYGIDKKCDEKFNLIDNNRYIKIQEIDKNFQIVEGILIALGGIYFLVIEIQNYNSNSSRDPIKMYFWAFIVYIIAVCGSLTFHAIAYIRMIKSDYSNYNCSDSITNEIIKKGNENNRKLIKYNMISFYIDVIIISGNLLGFIIGLILDMIDKRIKKRKPDNKNLEEVEAPYYAKNLNDN